MSATSEFDAVIGYEDYSKTRCHSWRLKGIKLQVSGGNTDRGRLYGKITKSGSTYTVKLFNSESFTDNGDHVASGTTTTTPPAKVSLAANGSLNLHNGSVWLADYAENNNFIELIVCLADEGDLARRFFSCTEFRNYDSTWGLNDQLAEAHRKVLHDVSKRFQHFLGAPGLARMDRTTFWIDESNDRRWPDLRRLANPETDLRDLVCWRVLWYGCLATHERDGSIYSDRAQEFERLYHQTLHSLEPALDTGMTGEVDRKGGATTSPLRVVA